MYFSDFNCFWNFFFSVIFLSQESKKHLAGLGTLGFGSLITEITANEGEEKDNKDSENVDGEGKRVHRQRN